MSQRLSRPRFLPSLKVKPDNLHYHLEVDGDNNDEEAKGESLPFSEKRSSLLKQLGVVQKVYELIGDPHKNTQNQPCCRAENSMQHIKNVSSDTRHNSTVKTQLIKPSVPTSKSINRSLSCQFRGLEA